MDGDEGDVKYVYDDMDDGGIDENRGTTMTFSKSLGAEPVAVVGLRGILG